jgi:CelD/BcsL family acetyltransferase involved in cellulose biosynthesis
MNFTIQSDFPDDLQPEWDALLAQNAIHVPFLRYFYQKIWWETRGGGEWPDATLLLVTARVEEKLVGIAPLFLSARGDEIPAIFNVGCVEVSDYLDLIFAPGYEAAFIGGLLDQLASLAQTTGLQLNLFNLIDSSPMVAHLQTAAVQKGWKVAVEKLQHSPFIPLPGNWETYLSGIDKKQRHEIRRKMRRAEESEIPVRWYIVEDSPVLDSELDGFFQLMRNDEDKAAFLQPEMQNFLRQVARCALDEGCLQLAFLEIGGQKAAAYLSFDYLDRVWVYNSGLNREFQSYSPGWVLLGYLLQWANENGRDEFDFMRGDEDYKYRFGAVDRFVVRVVLTPHGKI